MVKMIRLFLLIFLFSFNTAKSQYSPNLKLNEFIKQWIGLPYKFGGSTKKGIDCSKLTQKIYSEVYNQLIPSVSWKQWDFTSRIPKDSLTEGDLVFFKSKRSPSGWHVGLYLGNGLFFHAANRRDKVRISSLDEENYKKNYKGAGRLKDIYLSS